MVITHNGIDSSGRNFGPIYLGSLKRRNGLGGGVSTGLNGQDRYLNPNESLDIIPTSEFLLSLSKGQLKKFISIGLISVESSNLLTVFNDLLEKLDNDDGITDSNYFNTLNTSDESLLDTNFNLLLIKLDNDNGITDIDFHTLEISEVLTINTQLPLLLNKLDNDTGVTDINYSLLI